MESFKNIPERFLSIPSLATEPVSPWNFPPQEKLPTFDREGIDV
jgi:hypothetical protein